MSPINGDELKKHRIRRKLTQVELAKLVNGRQATISELENGEDVNVSLDFAQRVAAALDLPLDQLLTPIPKRGRK